MRTARATVRATRRRAGPVVLLCGALLLAGAGCAPAPAPPDPTGSAPASGSAPGSAPPASRVPVGLPAGPGPASDASPVPVPVPDAAPVPDGAAGPGRRSAAVVLAALPVKGRAPLTGYRRDLFGPAWNDTDRNGCDQRNQVLARDLTEVSFDPRTHGCVVLRGLLRDPYTGREIAFRRGADTSQAVQIDHVVALGDAWRKGAQRLDAPTRLRLATDPLNLLAVDGAVNRAKGAADAATWLPPARGYRCAYVARQVAVKQRYHLWVSAAEGAAMATVLASCPGQALVDGGPSWPPAP